jgi:hypothetical protein
MCNHAGWCWVIGSALLVGSEPADQGVRDLKRGEHELTTGIAYAGAQASQQR